MKIIKEYQILIESIAALKSEIKRKERRYEKLVNIYKPAGVKAINYCKEPVKGSLIKHDITEVARAIIELRLDIQCLHNELKQLYKQRKELEKVVEDLKDTEKQIIMHRMRDPKIPNWKLAKLVYVSERTVNNILKKIREDKRLRDFA